MMPIRNSAVMTGIAHGWIATLQNDDAAWYDQANGAGAVLNATVVLPGRSAAALLLPTFSGAWYCLSKRQSVIRWWSARWSTVINLFARRDEYLKNAVTSAAVVSNHDDSGAWNKSAICLPMAYAASFYHALRLTCYQCNVAWLAMKC